MGKSKGFLFAVRHREILIIILGLNFHVIPVVYRTDGCYVDAEVVVFRSYLIVSTIFSSCQTDIFISASFQIIRTIDCALVHLHCAEFLIRSFVAHFGQFANQAALIELINR